MPLSDSKANTESNDQFPKSSCLLVSPSERKGRLLNYKIKEAEVASQGWIGRCVLGLGGKQSQLICVREEGEKTESPESGACEPGHQHRAGLNRTGREAEKTAGGVMNWKRLPLIRLFILQSCLEPGTSYDK